MKWEGQRQSDNVEDRRGMGGSGPRIGGRGIGVGTIVIALAEQLRSGRSRAEVNEISVRVELPADCLAGVWAHHSQKGKGWLERGDIEEALNAASKIGDDTLQRASRGTVVPESFTHGTSEQRMRWFKRGLEGGQPAGCKALGQRSL